MRFHKQPRPGRCHQTVKQMPTAKQIRRLLRPGAKCSAGMGAKLRSIYGNKCQRANTKRGRLIIGLNGAGKSYLCRKKPGLIDQDKLLPEWLVKAPRTDLVTQLIHCITMGTVKTLGRIVLGDCWWHPSDVNLFWLPGLDTIQKHNKCKPMLDQFTEAYLVEQHKKNEILYQKYSEMCSTPLCTCIDSA